MKAYRMNRGYMFAFLLMFSQSVIGQTDSTSLRAQAKNYMQQGDYPNATLVLKKALTQSPGDADLQNDLLFNYYLAADYSHAVEYGKELTDKQGADIRSFQLLGMTYRAIEELKECERLYRNGIKSFPNSGVLYNEYGELLLNQKKPRDAIQQWEKGIQVDPNYSGNYYNATKFYNASADKIWALIYGEIFVNIESYSRRTPEIKDVLLDAYKKYYVHEGELKAPNPNNAFEQSFAGLLNKHAAVVGTGVTASSLTMLRTKILLDWFEKEPVKYPFRLFDYQRQLLKDGLFDAYNQWIFGAAQDLPAFQRWTQANQAAYDSFLAFQKGRIFKVPPGQQYRF
ncbi:tetratricopeptide repeat protein [Flavihumibacter petaseus]|uniref:Uncharacterized protein n=1 Tax=Flavihumibacter petaseus NBRC 106054 TaxID=1220578 RepID=A0A0E9MWR8_9BACT|nr:tetratricopeptide repeat protein [Flavihumibacter petaseus]GAO41861.1 hypothetical protein FPE01S_01_08760 [Flavihumibacter petaseus NBRC 106054]